jgi:iron complex transport system permease protein
LLITRARLPLALLLGTAALLLLMLASLGVGTFPLAPGDVARVLWSAISGAPGDVAANARAVVLEVRAPRVAAALAVGAALGVAGAAYQGVFRNPLVSPDILGVSSGCALGAVLAIIFGWPSGAMQAAAFAGGLGAAALVLAIGSRVRGSDPTLAFVLSGVVVGALLSAGVAFAKTVADPYNQLPAITFWLLGSFAAVVGDDLLLALPLMLLAMAPLALLRWRVDVLALDDDEARALGVDVDRLRLWVIAAATLATSAAVAIAGIIGWVGLVVPHAARLLAGPGFARMLPVSAILGAGFMLVVDTACRSLARTELPPGVVTALIGTPAFIALLAAAARRAS